MLESPPMRVRKTRSWKKLPAGEWVGAACDRPASGQQEHQTEVQQQIVYQKLHGSPLIIYGCYHTHEAPVKKGLAGAVRFAIIRRKAAGRGERMRTLATIALSFAAGVFAAVLLGVGVLAAVGGRGLPAGGTGAAGAEADDARPAAGCGGC